MSIQLNDYLHDALDKVAHTSTVEAFYHQFQAIKLLLASSQPDIPEAYFATRYTYGLLPEFQAFVLRFTPVTVMAAYRLALIHEESIYLEYFPEPENNRDKSSAEEGNSGVIDNSDAYNDPAVALVSNIGEGKDDSTVAKASPVRDCEQVSGISDAEEITKVDSTLIEIQPDNYNVSSSLDFAAVVYNYQHLAELGNTSFSLNNPLPLYICVVDPMGVIPGSTGPTTKSTFISKEFDTGNIHTNNPCCMFSGRHLTFSWEPGPLRLKIQTYSRPKSVMAAIRKFSHNAATFHKLQPYRENISNALVALDRTRSGNHILPSSGISLFSYHMLQFKYCQRQLICNSGLPILILAVLSVPGVIACVTSGMYYPVPLGNVNNTMQVIQVAIDVAVSITRTEFLNMNAVCTILLVIWDLHSATVEGFAYLLRFRTASPAKEGSDVEMLVMYIVCFDPGIVYHDAGSAYETSLILAISTFTNSVGVQVSWHIPGSTIWFNMQLCGDLAMSLMVVLLKASHVTSISPTAWSICESSVGAALCPWIVRTTTLNIFRIHYAASYLLKYIGLREQLVFWLVQQICNYKHSDHPPTTLRVLEVPVTWNAKINNSAIHSWLLYLTVAEGYASQSTGGRAKETTFCWLGFTSEQYTFWPNFSIKQIYNAQAVWCFESSVMIYNVQVSPSLKPLVSKNLRVSFTAHPVQPFTTHPVQHFTAHPVHAMFDLGCLHRLCAVYIDDDTFVCLGCHRHGLWLGRHVVQTVYRITEDYYRRPTSEEIAEYKLSRGRMNPAIEARCFFLGI